MIHLFLCHVRRRFHLSAFLNEATAVITFVGPNGYPVITCNLVDHSNCGLTLRSPVCMGYGSINDKAISVFHQGMTQIA